MDLREAACRCGARSCRCAPHRNGRPTFVRGISGAAAGAGMAHQSAGTSTSQMGPGLATDPSYRRSWMSIRWDRMR
jgi:hypothetical protein